MPLLDQERKSGTSKGDRFFLWSVVLLVMTGACFASWVLSFYVVMHPEEPWCYRILKKLKRIDPPKRFEVTKAPRGDFITAARLLDRYGKLGTVELQQQNAELMRAFLMNFRESKVRVPYVAGRFRVVQSYDMEKRDFFPSGIAAITQAENLPHVLVEYIFPTAPKNTAIIREVLVTGAEIKLERSRDLWALIHVERHTDGRMQFTVVPLPYGGWRLKESQESFTLKSPEELSKDHRIDLNIAAGLPVVRDPRLAKALANYKQFRRKILADRGDDQVALAGPELVRFDPDLDAPGGKAPAAGSRESASAGTLGAAPPTAGLSAQPPASARPLPTPAPGIALPPQPATRTPPSAIIGAELQPVAEVRPQPLAVSPGRVLSVGEASGLVEKYRSEEPAVLSGDFIVTGVRGKRIALRTRESLRDPQADPAKPGTSAALIVVDFPDGAELPAKDAFLTRDSKSGFLIRDVIRGRNDQITIVAAERRR